MKIPTKMMGNHPFFIAMLVYQRVMASETICRDLRTVKGIDCLGRGGIQALGKRLANASPLRRVLKIPRRFRQ